MKIVCDCGKEHVVESKDLDEKKGVHWMDSSRIMSVCYIKSDNPSDGVGGIPYVAVDKSALKLKCMPKKDAKCFWKPSYVGFDGVEGLYDMEYLKKMEAIAKLMGVDVGSLEYLVPNKMAPLAIRVEKNWFMFLAPRSE